MQRLKNLRHKTIRKWNRGLIESDISVATSIPGLFRFWFNDVVLVYLLEITLSDISALILSYFTNDIFNVKTDMDMRTLNVRVKIVSLLSAEQQDKYIETFLDSYQRVIPNLGLNKEWKFVNDFTLLPCPLETNCEKYLRWYEMLRYQWTINPTEFALKVKYIDISLFPHILDIEGWVKGSKEDMGIYAFSETQCVMFRGKFWIDPIPTTNTINFERAPNTVEQT